MTYKKTFLTIHLIVLPLTGLEASHAQQLERLLIPIAIEGQIAGGYGSLWETRLSIVNKGESPLAIGGIATTCQFPPCIPTAILPDSTIFPKFFPASKAIPGMFLTLLASKIEDLDINLRVQDLSRQAQTWGTELPVIRESHALHSETELLDIPTGVEFRSLLRIYDFDPAPGHSIRLRVYATDPARVLPEDQAQDDLIAEFDMPFRTDLNTTTYPGFADITLSDLPGLPVGRRLRISITPITTGLRFWAFVSVTNNETQHVTVVSPQE